MSWAQIRHYERALAELAQLEAAAIAAGDNWLARQRRNEIGEVTMRRSIAIEELDTEGTA